MKRIFFLFLLFIGCTFDDKLEIYEIITTVKFASEGVMVSVNGNGRGR